MSFSVISQNFLCFGWVSKISFFDNLAQKARAPQNTIKIEGSANSFFKKAYASRNGHFWAKKTQIQKFQLSFVFAYFFFFNNKKHKHLLKPLCLWCFGKPKKDNFQNLNLKH